MHCFSNCRPQSNLGEHSIGQLSLTFPFLAHQSLHTILNQMLLTDYQCQSSQTHSTITTICSSLALNSIAFPQAISETTTPKLYTFRLPLFVPHWLLIQFALHIHVHLIKKYIHVHLTKKNT